jgi:hypothetical protein
MTYQQRPFPVLFLCIFMFWLFVPILRAADRPTVQVVFDFAEKQYRRQMGSAATAVEKRALELILGDLNRRAPFLRFTSETQSAKLHIQLGNPAGGSEMHDVNFQLSVDGTDSESGKPLESGIARWTFRSASAYDSPLGSAEALAAEIGLKFQQGDYIDIVRNVLSAVPISHDGILVEKDPTPVWVIPFTKDDLCMDFPSRLKIIDELQTSVGRRSHELHVVANGVYEPADSSVAASFEHKILGTPADPPPDQSIALTDVRSIPPTNNKVLAVYVIEYHRMDLGCEEVIKPAGVETGGVQ